MKKKKAAGDLSMQKLIIAILVAIVIVIVIWGMISFNVIDVFRNWNDFNNTRQLNNSGTVECPNEVAKIGDIEGLILIRERYIYIDKKKTNIYWREDEKKLYLDYRTLNPLSKRDQPEIGTIERDSELHRDAVKIDPKFLDEYSYKFSRYYISLPHISDLIYLDHAYKPKGKNYLCKTDLDLANDDVINDCSDKCYIHNGTCNETKCLDGQVELVGTDCKTGSHCCVKEIDQKLTDGGLEIGQMVFSYVNDNGKKVSGFPTKGDPNRLFINGMILNYNVLLGNSRQVGKLPYSKPFCYMIRTDKRILLTQYYEDKNNQFIDFGNGLKGLSVPFELTDYGTEKIYEVAIFTPQDKKFAFKRIAIDHSKDPLKIDGPEVDPEEFNKTIFEDKVNTNFYILGLLTSLEGESLSDFKIVKSGSSITIYGYKNNNWVILNCNWWGDKAISKKKIYRTFALTIANNRCQL